MRIGLHRCRIPPHMHQHHRGLALGDHLSHSPIEPQGAYIVDHLRAGRQSPFRHPGLARIDRDGNVAFPPQILDDRNGPLGLYIFF